MRKALLLIFGLLFLIALEIAKVYFIMPFPGSQRSNSISFAYFLHTNIWWLRILGILLIVNSFTYFITKGRIWQKILLVMVVLFYGFIYYMFNFRFLADKIFHQPKQTVFLSAASDTTNRDRLVIGVVIDSQAKAYPIEIIGYHHQVQDSIHNQPFIVTYCTVCRTGRVYSPFVNGQREYFRLVGMDHFNAMFEDASTKSWWQQATGIAIAGKLKGQELPEIPSVQMRLGDWIAMYPNSSVLQPDTNYRKRYDSLRGYDEGTIRGKLEQRDTLSWQFKSWVVGVSINGQARAYDWNGLVKTKATSDSLAGTPLLLTVEPGGRTFHVLNRTVNGQTLQFQLKKVMTEDQLEDLQTHSTWKLDGTCIAGALQGRSLQRVQSYQEFWHSWKTFHPNTSRFNLKI